MAVGAAILLLLGIGIGFALGRATAPKPVVQAEPTATVITEETTLPAGVIEEVPTETIDAVTDEGLASEEPTADTKRPPRPKQLAPANGAVIDASRVNLRWTKVTDDSGKKVTYSFEIQNRSSNGTFGSTQIIKGLSATSYSARVLTVRRRWRVWAVDKAGNASVKSTWRSYIHKYTPPKKTVTPKPSDETT